jgi:hypothetical protein
MDISNNEINTRTRAKPADKMTIKHCKIYPITGLARPLRLQEFEYPGISRQPAYECGKVVSPKPPALFIPRRLASRRV